MKKNNISKHNLLVAVLTAIVITGVILAAENYLLPAREETALIDSQDQEASSVAAEAVQQIFSVDYNQGKDEWLWRVCTLSTPSGCGLFSSGADGMWQQYQAAKTQVEAYVEPLGKLADNGSEQVWQLAVHLSAPLPGSNRIQDSAYVVVIQTDAGWYFDRFLLDEEIDALLSGSPTPTQDGQ